MQLKIYPPDIAGTIVDYLVAEMAGKRKKQTRLENKAGDSEPHAKCRKHCGDQQEISQNKEARTRDYRSAFGNRKS